MKKKRSNSLNKNTNIVVKFYPSTDKEINKLLGSLNLTGVRVSNLIPRWAIDVPFWKESYFAEKLEQSELVEKIYRNVPVRRREFQEEVLEEGVDQ
jgi:hypothetical protein